MGGCSMRIPIVNSFFLFFFFCFLSSFMVHLPLSFVKLKNQIQEIDSSEPHTRGETWKREKERTKDGELFHKALVGFDLRTSSTNKFQSLFQRQMISLHHIR